MNYISKKGQSMTEYVLVLMLCLTMGLAITKTFKDGLQRVYRNATTARTGMFGMAP